MQFLELFIEASDEFYLPQSVLNEIRAKSDEINQALVPLIANQKLIVRATNLGSLFNHLNSSLGVGESETIALATELQADFIILDDLAARKAALNLGLNAGNWVNQYHLPNSWVSRSLMLAYINVPYHPFFAN